MDPLHDGYDIDIVTVRSPFDLAPCRFGTAAGRAASGRQKNTPADAIYFLALTRIISGSVRARGDRGPSRKLWAPDEIPAI
jgi:hypothetical protein